MVIAHLNYYEYDRGMRLTCDGCSWEGPAGEGSLEPYEQLFDVSCPECDKRLLVVSYPTADEVERAAFSGNEEAVKAQERREQQQARLAQRLADPDTLPDVPGGPIDVLWDFEESDGDVWTILRVGDRVLCREPAFWEGYERFHDVVKLLQQRYGSRLREVRPTQASELYLYGDRYSVSNDIEHLNVELGVRHTAGNKERGEPTTKSDEAP